MLKTAIDKINTYRLNSFKFTLCLGLRKERHDESLECIQGVYITIDQPWLIHGLTCVRACVCMCVFSGHSFTY